MNKITHTIIHFIAFILIGWAVYSILGKNYVDAVSSLLIVPILFAPRSFYRWWVLNKRYNKNFIYYAEFALIIICVVHMAGYLGLYDFSIGGVNIEYDVFAHAVISFFLVLYISLFFGTILRFLKQMSVVVFSFLAALSLGLFWEIFEFYRDKFFRPEHFEYMGRGTDMLVDVIANVVAMLIAAVYVYVFYHRITKKLERKEKSKKTVSV